MSSELVRVQHPEKKLDIEEKRSKELQIKLKNISSSFPFFFTIGLGSSSRYCHFIVGSIVQVHIMGEALS